LVEPEVGVEVQVEGVRGGLVQGPTWNLKALTIYLPDNLAIFTLAVAELLDKLNVSFRSECEGREFGAESLGKSHWRPGCCKHGPQCAEYAQSYP